MVAASSSRSLQSSCPRYSDLHRGLNPRLSIYPIHLSGNQSIDPSVPINQPIIISLNVTTNEIAPINRSINPINQSVRLIDQSVNPSINQSINRLNHHHHHSHSLTHSIHPSTTMLAISPINQSIDQAIDQSINPSIHPSTNRLSSCSANAIDARLMTDPANPSINQSLCPIDQSFLSITLTH